MVVTFNTIGSGNRHQLEMFKKNEKALITLDNIIQSPISFTPITTTVANNVSSQVSITTSIISLSGITSIVTNDILKINNLPLLPKQKEVVVAFRTDNKEYYDKFYYLFDRFVENISKDDFKVLYNEKPLSWKTSNYMNLEFLLRLEDNQSKADEILNDVMRYASSSTKISSQFIKIS